MKKEILLYITIIYLQYFDLDMIDNYILNLFSIKTIRIFFENFIILRYYLYLKKELQKRSCEISRIFQNFVKFHQKKLK